MEYVSINEAKEIFGKNFIGLDELQPFFSVLKKEVIIDMPIIKYKRELLKQLSKDYLLLLGVDSSIDGWKFNINNLRSVFGTDSDGSLPCFYNQDWYVKEKFSYEVLNLDWYLIRRELINETRRLSPNYIIKKNNIKFPSAILAVYTFFAFYFFYGVKLWENDFLWCSDKDHHGDRIYVGKYKDDSGINKDGLSIHRHLSLKQWHGAISVITSENES